MVWAAEAKEDHIITCFGAISGKLMETSMPFGAPIMICYKTNLTHNVFLKI